MTIEPIHEGDSLVLDVPVTFDSGAPVSSLSGATIDASASNVETRGALVIDAASTAISGNTATCTWSAGALAAGSWRVQVKVSKSGLTQTVADDIIIVEPSN